MDIDKVCTEEIKFVLTFENGTRIKCIQKQKEDIPKWMLPDEGRSTAAHGRCQEVKRKVGVDESGELCWVVMEKPALGNFEYQEEDWGNALWWPYWEGNPKRRGHMYPCSWFTLLWGRCYHNSVKQLYANKIKFKKRVGDLNFYARTKETVNRNQHPTYEILNLKNHTCRYLSF